jgi:hypothetical protein
VDSKDFIRRSPPVCLVVALVLALLGRLRLRRKYVGRVVPETLSYEVNPRMQLADFLEGRIE